MLLNFTVLIGAILAGLSAAFASDNSTWVQSTDVPAGNWLGVASSSNGKYLIASSTTAGTKSTGIYVSLDGAATWKNVFINGCGAYEQWNDVASSADGYMLYALQQDLGLYASSNQGASWTRYIVDPTLTYANYNRVSCSSSGGTVAVSLMGGYIYVSNNFGYTFTAAKSLGLNSFYFVSVSADGFSMTAGASWLYTSMNGGATWTQNRAPSLAWTDAAYSIGSNYAVAVAAHQQTYGGIYLSADRGNTWTLLPAADQTLSWQSVTIDSTGARITAVASTVGEYHSTDFGKTFAKGTLPSGITYKSIAGSSDGTFSVATSMYSGGIYYTVNN